MHERPSSRPHTGPARRLEAGLRLVQLVLALWLLAVPLVLPGPNELVTGKDVLVGGVLLTVTVAAAAHGAVRRIESTVVAVLGTLLIVASVLLEFGPADAAAARQWSEVVVGVLLLAVAAARTR